MANFMKSGPDERRTKMQLVNKTALITGGNSGIGFATARLLKAEGARIVITGRDKSKLEAARIELGNDVLAIQADLNVQADIERTALLTTNEFGRLEILFANAGVSGPTPVATSSRGAFEVILNTNVTEVFFTIQALLPVMNEGGSIILNGSVMRQLGRPETSAYAASKAAVSAMANVLAGELSPRGIRVNTLIPGAARTPIWTRGARAATPMEQTEKALVRGIPMGRLLDADELAQAVLFLASDASSGMTAAEIVVDGGASGAPWSAPIYR